MTLFTTGVLALVLVGVASWVMRVVPVTVVPAGRLPARAQRVLAYAGPAALAAMVATALTQDAGPAGLVTPSPMLFAVVVSGAVAWLTRRLGLTVVVGVLSLWLAQLVVPV
jgi:branched-subunit amino acid transport protein